MDEQMTIVNEAHFMTEPVAQDFQEYLTTRIRAAIKTYLEHEHIAFDGEQLPIDLRPSAQASFGDYSMPVMPWAGKNKLGRPPLQIAEALKAVLADMRISEMQEIT